MVTELSIADVCENNAANQVASRDRSDKSEYFGKRGIHVAQRKFDDFDARGALQCDKGILGKISSGVPCITAAV